MEKINQPNTKRYYQYMIFDSRKDTGLSKNDAIQYLNRVSEREKSRKLSPEYDFEDLPSLEIFIKNEIASEQSIQFKEVGTITVLVKLIERIEDEQLMKEICSFAQNDTEKFLDIEAISKLIQKVKNSLME